MVLCRGCGTSNPDGDRFCGECGNALAIETTCPSCQAVVRPGRRFCAACGARIVATEPAEVGRQPAPVAQQSAETPGRMVADQVDPGRPVVNESPPSKSQPAAEILVPPTNGHPERLASGSPLPAPDQLAPDPVSPPPNGHHTAPVVGLIAKSSPLSRLAQPARAPAPVAAIAPPIVAAPERSPADTGIAVSPSIARPARRAAAVAVRNDSAEAAALFAQVASAGVALAVPTGSASASGRTRWLSIALVALVALALILAIWQIAPLVLIASVV